MKITLTKLPSQRKGSQHGSSLIEVLVSLVIIMLGVLGVMGLKVMSARAVADSNLRSNAAMYAQDMFERIRANPIKAANGRYNYNGGSLPTAPSTIEEVDLSEWGNRLQNNLPNASATVSVSAGSATVVIQWVERAAKSSAGQTVSFSFNARP
jgi:type IV pilus assembly protein PilV